MSIRLTQRVWRTPMDPDEKLLLLALADLANDRGALHQPPELTTLAAATGLPHGRLAGALTGLIVTGRLAETRRALVLERLA